MGTSVFSQVSVIAFDLDDTLWPCMPTIHRAEEILYQWLTRYYPRITQNFDPEQMVAYRREFSARDVRYAIDMTGMRRDFLHHLFILIIPAHHVIFKESNISWKIRISMPTVKNRPSAGKCGAEVWPTIAAATTRW